MKEPILYKTLRPLIVFLVKILYKPEIIGTENIPEDGKVVLAGNHTNNLDCVLLITSTKRTIHFLAKDELVQGFKKGLFLNMGIIPVNRRIHDKDALQKAIDVLNNDKVIGIFPEGTINRTDNTIIPFKIGAVKMASVTNTKIVPFIITGEYKIGNKGLKIEFLEPIEIPKKEDLTEYNEELENIISKKLKKEKK
ncbi:MAG: 1-acyl-sn-glycerol-3-phosphate acyltransferase [Bacilli bacterium]|nr:1-acyl-sn-glycerol-3-phosphate acyltransferase [Bacilli bacterium]